MLDMIRFDEAFSGLRGCAVNSETVAANIKSAMARKWLEHPWVKPHAGNFMICGGGPSIKWAPMLNRIRRMADRGGHVCAVNGTHDHFFDLPRKRLGPVITPSFAVLLDPKPRVARYIKPRPGVNYFIASQCDPATLDVFDAPGVRKYLYHHEGHECSGLLGPKNHAVPPIFSTVGLNSILVGYRLGFRKFNMFAMESSYRTDEDGRIIGLHGYDKEKEYLDVMPPVAAKDGDTIRYFLTNAHMACQAEDFRLFVPWWKRNQDLGRFEPISLTFHGDGLLNACAAILHNQHPWVTNADGLPSGLRNPHQGQRLAGSRQGQMPADIQERQAA